MPKLSAVSSTSRRKRSKRAAKYQDGLKLEHCGLCVYYLPKPENHHKGGCDQVQGEVVAGMWCKQFRSE